MLLLLGVNAAVYQYKFYPHMDELDSGSVPFGAKIVAVISLVLWMARIVAGRLTAYEL